MSAAEQNPAAAGADLSQLADVVRSRFGFGAR